MVAVERWGVGATGLGREVARRPEVVSHGAEVRQGGPEFAEAHKALGAALATETATLGASALEV